MPEVDKTYMGKVKSIVEFGAFIEILPGKEGLLHISEVDWKRIDSLDGILAEGDDVEVKLLEIDPKTGKLRLSRKALMDKPQDYIERERPPRERGERGSRGDRHDRGDRGDRGGDRRRYGNDRDRHDRRR